MLFELSFRARLGSIKTHFVKKIISQLRALYALKTVNFDNV